MTESVSKKNKFLRTVLLCAGIAMLITGIAWGEPRELYQKAVVICLECIGLG